MVNVSHSFASDGVLRYVQAMCCEHDVELLYLTVFGSCLYGTSCVSSSDLDIRGLFLPSMRSFVLEDVSHSLHFSTQQQILKNTAHDVDIDLYSLQRWLLDLLPQGDVGALDLLFSPSHEACTLYYDARMKFIFSNPLSFIDRSIISGAMKYAMKQTKAYGIRGSRIAALRAVQAWLQDCVIKDPSVQYLGEILNALLHACADERFCKEVFIGSHKNKKQTAHESKNDERALCLAGKIYPEHMRIFDVCKKVDHEVFSHGQRAEAADHNGGLDFKAISHAVRALEQVQNVLMFGKIDFPLANREHLTNIKRGIYSWKKLEKEILQRFADIHTLQAMESTPETTCRTALRQKVILHCYDLDE